MDNLLILTIKKCELIMEDCGFKLPKIDFSINGRLSRTLGMCGRTANGFTIEISKGYLTGCIKTNNYKKLEELILHEMCHTLPDGGDHGKVWKTYISKINNNYGYNISRITEIPLEIKEFCVKNGVLIVCEDCHREHLVNGSREVAKHPECYRCECGGRLVVGTY